MIRKGDITTLAQFKRNLSLICSNAVWFNSTESYMGKESAKFLHAAEEIVANTVRVYT
jgi:hypothetical protein